MDQTETLPSSELSARGVRFARVLPLAFVTYSLAYLDRMNIQFGAAGGMKTSLHASDAVFTLFNSSFFFGYLLFQIPGAGYAAHRSCKKLIFWALVAWGVLASLTGVIRNVNLLIADRVLLGVVEGVVFPSLLVFLTHWFTRSERSRANVILILGNPLTMFWASGASGKLVEYFQGHRFFGLEGWQLMFLAEGVPTLIWAVLWWLMADDHPAEARWLTPEQAAAVQGALDAEQRHVRQVRNYWAAFRDSQVLILCGQFLAWSLGIYGLNSWLAVVVKQGSGLGIGTVGLLNMIPYAFGIVAMLAVSFASDRTLIRKAFVWPFMFIGAAGFVFSYLVGTQHFWLSFAGIIVACACMYAPYGPFWAMVPEMVSRNVAGESMALINTLGALGGLLGTLVVGLLNYATHSPAAGFACMAAALALAGILTLAVHTRAPVPDRGFEVVVPEPVRE